MSRYFVWVLILVLGLVNVNCAQTPPTSPLQKRANDVVAVINDPKGFDELFSSSFKAAVPAAQFAQISDGLKAQLGRAVRVQKVVAKNATSGEVSIVFERNAVVRMNLSVEPQPPYRVNGLLITGTESGADSFDAIKTEFAALPGESALGVYRLDGNSLAPLASFHDERSLAVGSSFKLYVLAELVRQIETRERRWTDVVELRASSLPSGQLQNWPQGAPLTLHTLAALMISNSDNTATDQLITTLGRERIEKMMSVAGHTNPARSFPFLQTIELFKIKGAPQPLAATYAAKTVNEKRKMLAGTIRAFPKSQISLDFLAKPSFVKQIEWFASPRDLARAMNWLRLHSNAPADKTRGILEINKGVSVAEAARWSYVGYKGGSETGVISLTFLLRSKSGQWFVVSGTWNNEKAPVEDTRFVGLMQKTVTLLREKSS